MCVIPKKMFDHKRSSRRISGIMPAVCKQKEDLKFFKAAYEQKEWQLVIAMNRTRKLEEALFKQRKRFEKDRWGIRHRLIGLRMKIIHDYRAQVQVRMNNPPYQYWNNDWQFISKLQPKILKNLCD